MPFFDQLSSVQISWFTATEFDFNAGRSAIAAILGVEAFDIRKVRPPASPIPLSLATFVTEQESIRLQIAAGRTDVFITPLEDAFTPEIHHLAFENFDRYLGYGLALCDTFDQSFRQAINVMVRRSVGSADEAALVFEKILRTDHDLSGATDLHFQINRRMFKDSIEINRVLQWRVEQVQVMQFDPSSPTESRHVAGSMFVSYLNDVNTVPVQTPRNAAEQKSAMMALIDAVQETIRFSSAGDLK